MRTKNILMIALAVMALMVGTANASVVYYPEDALSHAESGFKVSWVPGCHVADYTQSFDISYGDDLIIWNKWYNRDTSLHYIGYQCEGAYSDSNYNLYTVTAGNDFPLWMNINDPNTGDLKISHIWSNSQPVDRAGIFLKYTIKLY